MFGIAVLLVRLSHLRLSLQFLVVITFLFSSFLWHVSYSVLSLQFLDGTTTQKNVLNIFLAEELTAGETLPQEVKRRRFADFYHDLVETLAEARGRQHILSLLKELWHYFATFYQLTPQELVTLLRITDIDEFERRTMEIAGKE